MKSFIEENNISKFEKFNIIIEGVKHKYSLYFDDNLHIWEDRSVEDKRDRKAGKRVIYAVVNGGCEIEKLPFRPKIGEMYWTYSDNAWTGDIIAIEIVYSSVLYDHFRIKNNFAFRTREEAEDPKNIARVKEYCGVLDNE